MTRQKGHATVDKIIAILEYVAANPAGCTVQTVITATGIPSSTVYRIVESFRAHGYLHYEGHGKGLAIGPAFGWIAGLENYAKSLRDIARPVLSELAVALGESVKLSRISDFQAEVAIAVTGEQKYKISINEGEKFPLHAGAASKILLAWAPTAVFDEVVSRGLNRYTERTITDASVLRSELEHVKQIGYARDSGEYDARICAVAFPIQIGNSGRIAAISIPYIGPIDSQRYEQILSAGRLAATTIEAESRRMAEEVKGTVVV